MRNESPRWAQLLVAGRQVGSGCRPALLLPKLGQSVRRARRIPPRDKAVNLLSQLQCSPLSSVAMALNERTKPP